MHQNAASLMQYSLKSVIRYLEQVCKKYNFDHVLPLRYFAEDSIWVYWAEKMQAIRPKNHRQNKTSENFTCLSKKRNWSPKFYHISSRNLHLCIQKATHTFTTLKNDETYKNHNQILHMLPKPTVWIHL